MSLETDIVAALKSFTALTAIVGSGDAARIEPDEPDETTELPLVFYEISKEPLVDLQGRGGAGFSTLTITCRAYTRAAATALGEAVKHNGTDPGTGLVGYCGAFESWLESEVYASVPAEDGSGRAYRDCVQEYIVWYSEVA